MAFLVQKTENQEPVVRALRLDERGDGEIVAAAGFYALGQRTRARTDDGRSLTVQRTVRLQVNIAGEAPAIETVFESSVNDALAGLGQDGSGGKTEQQRAEGQT